MERKHKLVACNTCQVGINPLSVDWRVLRDRAKRFPNLIVVDIKSCDKTVMRLMEPSTKRKLLYAYQTTEDTALGKWIATMCVKMFRYYAIIKGQINEEDIEIVASFNESVASGQWTTTEMDGDWVCFIYRLAFRYFAARLDVADNYTEHVNLQTYGDDHIASVSDEVAPWFNRRSIAEFCETFLGVTLTSLNKVPIMQEKDPALFDKWEDLEFLQRKFHLDKKSGSVLSPLKKESIWSSLLWTSHKYMRQSEAVEYYIQIMDNALIEIAMHGNKAYTDFERYFKPKLRALGGQWAPTWTYRKKRREALMRCRSTDIATNERDHRKMLASHTYSPCDLLWVVDDCIHPINCCG